MNIDQLNAQFANDTICRRFFEAARWPAGRICPHCSFNISYKIRINGPNTHRYECKRCKRHFTVTTKTALHSTKLPLHKWLQAMYLIVSSSKGAELLEASINGNYISELAKPSGTGIHFEEGQLHFMLYTIYSETQIQDRAEREHEIALDSFRKFLGDDYSDTKLNRLIKASKSKPNHFVEVYTDTEK